MMPPPAPRLSPVGDPFPGTDAPAETDPAATTAPGASTGADSGAATVDRPWLNFRAIPLEERRASAWLGDAVLALWARDWLRRTGRNLDQTAFTRLTSNQFLSALGQPDAVEAWIGQTFAQQGFPAVSEMLDAFLLPIFHRQEANRINLVRPSGARRDKRRRP